MCKNSKNSAKNDDYRRRRVETQREKNNNNKGRKIILQCLTKLQFVATEGKEN